MKEFYNQNIEEIYKYFNSSINGLDDNIIKENEKKYGKNIINEKKRKSILKVFFEQFKDTLVIILIISAIISIFLNELESTIVIFVVLSINASLGTYQYQKAEKSLNSLRNLSSPDSYVIRNNKKIKIKSYELVCGDIVIVNPGDLISADGRIIEEQALEINESSLTGESVPVQKNNNVLINENKKEIIEQKNMVFSGTYCTKGSAKYIVCNVGDKTEIGKIANTLTNMEIKKTPLQESLDKFSKYLSIIIIMICLMVFLINVYRNANIFDSLMFAVALAVAAIPEALSTIVTIVLAIGTEKMAKANAIIKDIKSVESLGCISVICTDKTGTLTTNEMVVIDAINYIEINKFKNYVFLSTNYDELQSNNNPTELALINYSNNNNYIYEKIQEITFTSDRKLMSNLIKLNNKNYIFTKGAVDILIEKCDYIENKNLVVINKQLKKEILSKVDYYAKNGKRIIGFAYKEINKNNINYKDENGLIFIGFITILDPPRKESKEAVKKCKKAGIKPIMLTGDYKNTAISIATDIGIFNEGDIALSGKELDNITDKQLYTQIEKISVYARLTPNHKIRIVEAWQKKNKVVAMTGDGVNDALALAKSDIAISMGNGTEVAKDASSMILVDNNFNTIVKAISNGRKIYLNIQNAICFLLSGNLAAILLVLTTSFLNLPIPFLPIHLLFINLLTDSFPAIAIGIQDYDDELLNKNPRNKKQNILTKKLIIKTLLEGIIIYFSCYLGYIKGLEVNVDTARAMAFSILCLGRLFHSFNSSSNISFIFWKKINKYLILSFIVGIILINSVLFIPYLKQLFYIKQLNINLILLIYFYSLLPTVIIQLYKIFK